MSNELRSQSFEFDYHKEATIPILHCVPSPRFSKKFTNFHK